MAEREDEEREYRGRTSGARVYGRRDFERDRYRRFDEGVYAPYGDYDYRGFGGGMLEGRGRWGEGLEQDFPRRYAPDEARDWNRAYRGDSTEPGYGYQERFQGYGRGRDYDYDSPTGGRGGFGARGRERDYGLDRSGRMGRYERDWDYDTDFYGPYAGVGPRGYQRANERIHEEVCERLTRHGQIDASEIQVEIQNGEVTLRGTVENRRQKRMAEAVIEQVFGVRDVHNELRILRHG